MRTAVIDLGTNTFNLLIADVNSDGFTIIHSEKEGVALGMGGINKNTISPDAFERGLTTLRHFKSICSQNNVQVINSFGTSALRGAENAIDFVQQIHSELAITVSIISGEKEAELIYKGITWSYDFQLPAMIMDIGGGSTEFIFANKNGIIEKVSLDIGILRIFQLFTFSDPFNKEDIQKVKDWLDEKSGNFFKGKKQEVLIGASGTFETFYEMIYQKEYTEKIKAEEVSLESLLKVTNDILNSTEKERDTNEMIIPIRKKMAPIAAIKVQWIIEELGIKRVFISPCSLKEGALK
jgi:exopolyphosphatase/guanosine-5'-triphosphate,3'-diphosphate pyrophosphatase